MEKSNLRKCKLCKRTMRPKKVRWVKMPQYVATGSRGLCSTCYKYHSQDYPLIFDGNVWRDRIEDIEYMLEGGESLEGVLRRLNVSESTLERGLYRHKRNDLLKELKMRRDR